MFIIGKAFRFEAAHYLPDHGGECRYLHGHSYEVTVSVCGPDLQRTGVATGMLVDFAEIKSRVAPLIKNLDHNGLVQDNMDGRPSTAENIAQWLAAKLQLDFRGDTQLHSVCVRETATSYAEWRHECKV